MISVCHGNDEKSWEEVAEWALAQNGHWKRGHCGKGHCRRGHWEKGNQGGTLGKETLGKSHWEKGNWGGGIAGVYRIWRGGSDFRVLLWARGHVHAPRKNN